jgi:hypothetical protein
MLKTILSCNVSILNVHPPGGGASIKVIFLDRPSFMFDETDAESEHRVGENAHRVSIYKRRVAKRLVWLEDATNRRSLLDGQRWLKSGGLRRGLKRTNTSHLAEGVAGSTAALF